MKATDICAKASELTGGERERTHGNKVENHQCIATLWNAYLRNAHKLLIELDAKDIALMMALLKIARTQRGSHNLDDFVDMAGYAGIAGEIAGVVDSWVDAPSSQEP